MERRGGREGLGVFIETPLFPSRYETKTADVDTLHSADPADMLRMGILFEIVSGESSAKRGRKSGRLRCSSFWLRLIKRQKVHHSKTV